MVPLRRFVSVTLLVVMAGALVLPGPPARSAANQYLNESFESAPSEWTDGWFDAAVGSRNRFSSISGGVDGDALRVSIPAGSHFGSAAHYRFGDNGQAEPDELYYRYFVRFPESFVNHGKGKLPGPAGMYSSSGRNGIKPSDGNPGWSARMQFAPTYTSRDSSYTQLGFYVYHRDQANSVGDSWDWDPQTAALRHGDWYCVEGRVKMNTPGVKDGVLEGWVDEQLAFHRSDLRFRGTSDGGIDVKSFWFDVYYGGNDPAPGSLAIDFDSLVLGDDRIGCGDVASRFKDTAGNAHADSIGRLAHAGITYGCNPPTNDRFCPNNVVTRGQMSAFLTRALDLPPASKDYFDDDTGSVFESTINSLAESEITLGCNPPTNDAFCPDRTVTRGQMAAFLVRALDLPPGDSDRFIDDDGTVFEDVIDRLAHAGITRGCNPPTNDRYCPHNPVTRAQMATFLSRALDLPSPPSAPGPEVPAVPEGFDAVVPVGWSIQAVANQAPPGARILLESGTHLRQSVEPRAGQQFVGGPATVLDGQGDVFSAFSGSAADVVVENVELTGYSGALRITGNRWTVADVVIRGNAYAAEIRGDAATIVDSSISDHRETAIVIEGAANTAVRSSEISFSNQDELTTFAAAIRIIDSADTVIEGSHIHDNHGFGIWNEGASTDTVISDNVIENSARSGIAHDDAYGVLIESNVLSGNGLNTASALSLRSAILVHGPDATVRANTILNNPASITARDHSASIGAPGPLGPYVPIRLTVVDNTTIGSGRLTGNMTSSQAASAVIDRNSYQTSEDRPFVWVGAAYDWSGWQGLGFDLNGSLTPG